MPAERRVRGGPAGAQGPAGAASTVPGPAGPQGPTGATGAPGTGIVMLGSVPTVGDLPSPSSHNPGNAYTVLSDGHLYVVDPARTAWNDVGAIQGPVGPPGPQGTKGDPGNTGPQGIQGVKGDTGAAGSAGASGSAGAQGPQGLKGDKGDKGDTGLTGAASTVPGPQGIQGVPGPTGPQGEQGEAGEQGEPGPGGLSRAYNTIALTRPDWIAAMAGSSPGPGAGNIVFDPVVTGGPGGIGLMAISAWDANGVNFAQIHQLRAGTEIWVRESGFYEDHLTHTGYTRLRLLVEAESKQAEGLGYQWAQVGQVQLVERSNMVWPQEYLGQPFMPVDVEIVLEAPLANPVVQTLAAPSSVPAAAARTLEADGHLYAVNQTNTAWIDVTPVQGPQGVPGEPGPPGAGAGQAIYTWSSVRRHRAGRPAVRRHHEPGPGRRLDRRRVHLPHLVQDHQVRCAGTDRVGRDHGRLSGADRRCRRVHG